MNTKEFVDVLLKEGFCEPEFDDEFNFWMGKKYFTVIFNSMINRTTFEPEIEYWADFEPEDIKYDSCSFGPETPENILKWIREYNPDLEKESMNKLPNMTESDIRINPESARVREHEYMLSFNSDWMCYAFYTWFESKKKEFIAYANEHQSDFN